VNKSKEIKDRWLEILGALLCTLCTASSRDFESIKEASKPNIRELEVKEGGARWKCCIISVAALRIKFSANDFKVSGRSEPID
jgi:hypothetical protein